MSDQREIDPAKKDLKDKKPTTNRNVSLVCPLSEEKYYTQEEGKTIDKFFNPQEANAILGLTIEELQQPVSYRGNENKELLLTARHANSQMRKNYQEFIYEVGRNIYPLIIAMDKDTDSEGVGTSYTLFQEDGSTLSISPARDSD